VPDVSHTGSGIIPPGDIMIIGDKLRSIREEKKMSQGDVEEKTGLLRCYVSRVENGYTVPAVETLEKFARALEVPMYQLFYEGEEPPAAPKKFCASEAKLFGNSGKELRDLMKLRKLLGQMKDHDRSVLLSMAKKMARTNGR
jgi:transcriptional regulator with XRE-family HTH domain